MYQNKDLFDLSNFPKDSKYFCNDNKKVPGKMKDEYGGTAIYEFVGPKPNMYSILDVNNYEKSVYKGYNSNIGHDEFINVHSNKKVIRHNMRRIKSRDHIITHIITMLDVYKKIDDYNPDKENKILIVFDDMIADMIHNKKLNSIVTQSFIRGRKLNISLVFIPQSYFKVPKDVRLNTRHFFLAKIPNKRELQQIGTNRSSKIHTEGFVNIYRKCTNEPYFF